MSARRLYIPIAAVLLVAALPFAVFAADAPAPAVEGKEPPPVYAEPREPLQVTNVDSPIALEGRAFELTVYGEGFDDRGAEVAVLLGDVVCVDVRVQSPSRLKATAPSGATTAGVASLTVTNPDGESVTFEDAVCIASATGGFSSQVTLFQMRRDWRGFMEWFKLGGPLMYVLAVISFFGVAWAIHCLLILRRSQIVPKRFMEGLSGRLMQGDIKGATRDCARAKCVFAKVVLSGLRKVSGPAEKIREAMAAAGSRESAHLQQKISYLANVGTISPMLGLLGTVFGMIMAFNIISSGEVRHVMLAAAIAQAMVTTAAGLVIGIPSMAIYFYLRGRLLRLITHMEVVADEVAGTIIEKGESE